MFVTQGKIPSKRKQTFSSDHLLLNTQPSEAVDSDLTIHSDIEDDNSCIEEACIDGKDNRRKVENTNEGVYQCIVLIVGKVRGKNYSGTGCLVDSKTVLTCAHNIYCRQFKEKGTEIKIILKANGGTEKAYKVKKAYYPKEYVQKKNKQFSKYDFGILQLERSLEEECRYLPIDEIKSNIEEAKLVQICGYPGEKEKTMWTETGLSQVIKDFFKYKIATTIGQSGSPVIWQNEKGEKVIIGVHIGSNEQETENIAVRFTEEKIAIIKKWYEEMALPHPFLNCSESNPKSYSPKINKKHHVEDIREHPEQNDFRPARYKRAIPRQKSILKKQSHQINQNYSPRGHKKNLECSATRENTNTKSCSPKKLIIKTVTKYYYIKEFGVFQVFKNTQESFYITQ